MSSYLCCTVIEFSAERIVEIERAILDGTFARLWWSHLNRPIDLVAAYYFESEGVFDCENLSDVPNFNWDDFDLDALAVGGEDLDHFTLSVEAEAYLLTYYQELEGKICEIFQYQNPLVRRRMLKNSTIFVAGEVIDSTQDDSGEAAGNLLLRRFIESGLAEKFGAE